jgi:hypothetical protein
MSLTRVIIVALAAASFATDAAAQRGTGSGPVAAACQDEIAKYCSDKSHGNRGVRTCLEKNQDKVSEACRTALETTGGGRGRGISPSRNQ